MVSMAGLSYPDSVCTALAMSVVEDFYDERTAIFAAQELGRRYKVNTSIQHTNNTIYLHLAVYLS